MTHKNGRFSEHAIGDVVFYLNREGTLCAGLIIAIDIFPFNIIQQHHRHVTRLFSVNYIILSTSHKHQLDIVLPADILHPPK